MIMINILIKRGQVKIIIGKIEFKEIIEINLILINLNRMRKNTCKITIKKVIG
jgi:hypothetical protein